MRRRPMREGSTAGGRIVHVVLFFEILLVLAAVLITLSLIHISEPTRPY